MLIILSLLAVGLLIGHFCQRVSLFKGLERSISYTIFAMLFIFGISIGANPTVVDNIGQYGAQAAVLAVCGVAGSLAASLIAHKLFNRKGGGDAE